MHSRKPADNMRYMSDHNIQFCMIALQFIALTGLGWYCIETRRMRKSSQGQVEVSLKLIDAAMDQVEGLSKPCLSLASELRDGSAAILEMHGAVGNTKAASHVGCFIVQNIGNGIALNVEYYFKDLNSDAKAHPETLRYVQNVLADQRVGLPEPQAVYSGLRQAIFEYSSIGGRRYRTTIDMNNYVLTSFRFESLK